MPSGVEIIGCIINKVDEAKYDKVNLCHPRPAPAGPRSAGRNAIQADSLQPDGGGAARRHRRRSDQRRAGAAQPVGKMVIGAMPPQQAIEYMTPRHPAHHPGHPRGPAAGGDGSACRNGSRPNASAGMILTGGTPPQIERKTDDGEDSRAGDTRAGRYLQHRLQDRQADSEDQAGRSTKIRAAEEMVDEFVDVDRILEVAARRTRRGRCKAEFNLSQATGGIGSSDAHVTYES